MFKFIKSKLLKPTRIIVYLLVIFISITFLSPFIFLHLSRNSVKSTPHKYSQYFATDYDSSRKLFLSHIPTFKKEWKNVNTSSFPIDSSDNLYIDSIELTPEKTKDNLIVITTGVHGIEGYIGATMMEVFIDTILPTLDKDTTGVLLISPINPYGMKYKRRYNENNVDLNRNFIYDWTNFDKSSNKDYPIVENFLEPQSKINNIFLHETSFYSSLVSQIVKNGSSTLSDALLSGQYEYPKGVYYGGQNDEKSTTYIKDILNKTVNSEYKNIVHLDLHSGYGPRYSMSIFNSALEPMTYSESVSAFGYSNVIAVDSPGYYPTTGDITEYFYKLAKANGRNDNFYSTCFEFGTLGDEFINSVTSMKYTIDENRNNSFPTSNDITSQILSNRYSEMFYPAEGAWRDKAVEDFKSATNGVLTNKLK